MTLQVKRAYVDAEPGDGYRVLVDRLWPRGRTKEALHLDRWAKELAPSTELRTWFGHDPARWDEFQRRYRAELASPERAALLADLAQRARRGSVTLVYAARDEEHNEARVIAEELERQGPTPAASPAGDRGTILTEEQELDDASRQSFPASDSPAWSGSGTISRSASNRPKATRRRTSRDVDGASGR